MPPSYSIPLLPRKGALDVTPPCPPLSEKKITIVLSSSFSRFKVPVLRRYCHPYSRSLLRTWYWCPPTFAFFSYFAVNASFAWMGVCTV